MDRAKVNTLSSSRATTSISSEESLPMLARIMAKHHGFKCTVLFDIDPKTGEIVAGTPSNIPGLEALKTADLAVVFLRFQDLPDDQMKHFDDYLKRGGPVVGMRTATHGFNIKPGKKYSKYSFRSNDKDYKLGFGHQVLGQNMGRSLRTEPSTEHTNHDC